LKFEYLILLTISFKFALTEESKIFNLIVPNCTESDSFWIKPKFDRIINFHSVEYPAAAAGCSTKIVICINRFYTSALLIRLKVYFMFIYFYIFFIFYNTLFLYDIFFGIKISVAHPTASNWIWRCNFDLDMLLGSRKVSIWRYFPTFFLAKSVILEVSLKSFWDR